MLSEWIGTNMGHEEHQPAGVFEYGLLSSNGLFLQRGVLLCGILVALHGGVWFCSHDLFVSNQHEGARLPSIQQVQGLLVHHSVHCGCGVGMYLMITPPTRDHSCTSRRTAFIYRREHPSSQPTRAMWLWCRPTRIPSCTPRTGMAWLDANPSRRCTGRSLSSRHAHPQRKHVVRRTRQWEWVYWRRVLPS